MLTGASQRAQPVLARRTLCDRILRGTLWSENGQRKRDEKRKKEKKKSQKIKKKIELIIPIMIYNSFLDNLSF